MVELEIMISSLMGTPWKKKEGERHCMTKQIDFRTTIVHLPYADIGNEGRRGQPHRWGICVSCGEVFCAIFQLSHGICRPFGEAEPV